MTHVAVTGANGMTGSHIVSLLKSKGFSVNSVTRNVWDLTEWRSFDEMDYIFKNVSAVFHFGAQLPNNNLIHDNLKTKQIFDANTRSCLNLAEWAKFKGIPIIFLSSSAIYKNPNAYKITEADLKVGTQFGGFYAYSKILAEDIFSYLSLEGLKSIVFRPSSLYGYGLPSNKFVQNCLNIASAGGEINITQARNKINFIHAHDVAYAALQAYKSKSWGVFNIASKENHSILEVAKFAVSILGKGKINILNDNKEEINITRFNLDCELATKSFGFKPKIKLKEGMSLMIDKLRNPK